MPSISSCPYCREQLAVPAGAPQDADVRCPLCQAEFTLGEVHDMALPELILVSTTRESTIASLVESNVAQVGSIDAWTATGPDASISEETEQKSESTLSANGRATDDGTREGSPATDQPATDQPATDQPATDQPATDTPANHIDSDRIELGNESPVNGASTIDDVALAAVTGVGLTKSMEPKPGEGESGVSFDPASFQFGQSPTESFDAEVAAAIESRPRPKKKQANMAVEMAKVIGGGFLGLILAYQILLCAGRDPLQIARSWPGFVPASMRE